MRTAYHVQSCHFLWTRDPSSGARGGAEGAPQIARQQRQGPLVHLSEQAMALLTHADLRGPYVFSLLGTKPFPGFSRAKRRLDQLSGVAGWRLHDLRRTCVSRMARLGIARHVADKVLNHQCGTISGVAAVYQRHEFLVERQEALGIWGRHLEKIASDVAAERRRNLQSVAWPTLPIGCLTLL
jgi:hypothetical protein